VTGTNEPPRLFTIGHSNHPIDGFIAVANAAGVQVIADVRSSPFSRIAPQFNLREFRQSLSSAGIQYVPMPELGGRPSDPHYYDPDGHVSYERLAGSSDFQHGLDRLQEGMSKYRVSIMCGEEDPIDCHRRLLVGRVLAMRGVEVVHVRGDGQLEDEAATTAREQIEHPNRYQPSLFGRKEEEWRSIRSVSGSTAPPTSSAR
jgi:uncharacterized protein (DUF488 family)